MGLEAATYISSLSASNPTASDLQSQGDDHLRLIKSVLQSTFPNASGAFYFPSAVAEKTVDYTVVSPADNNKLFSYSVSGASRTLTIPATATDGFIVTAVKTDNSANILTCSTAGTINGATTLVLRNQWDYVQLRYSVADSEWYAISSARKTIAPISTSADLTLSNLHIHTLLQVDASAAARTITLPNTLPAGTWVDIRKTDATANTVTLDATSGGNINGAATATLKFQYEMHRIWWDGTTWSLPVYDNIPPGATMMWWTDTAPTGWALFEGQAISRTGNPRLFALFSTLYGAGDGVNTFNLPDPRGRFLRVWDHAKANDPDRATRTAPAGSTITAGDHVGTEQADEIKSHQHDMNTSNSGTNYQNGGFTAPKLPVGADKTGFTGGNETRGKNVYVGMIVKLG